MKPILFIDFDGTLCTDRFWRSLPEDEQQKAQELLFGNDKTIVKEWMLGKHSAEEVNEYLARHLKRTPKEIWELFVLDCKTMWVDKKILDKINELRDRYTAILITANMDSFSRFTVPALKLDQYFDEISNSFYTGKMKVDNGGEIYQDLAKKHGNPSLSGCFAIDDSADACRIFEKLGGVSFLITPKRNLSFYLGEL